MYIVSSIKMGKVMSTIKNIDKFKLTERDVFKQISLRERISGGMFVLPDPENPQNGIGFYLPSIYSRIFHKYFAKYFTWYTNARDKIRGTKKYKVVPR